MDNNENYINQEIIRLIKSGVDPRIIQDRIAEEDKKSYSPNFVTFMQDMLDKYHVKRTEIARRTGISQDYLYKVLNGSKKTAEKDYVTAICIAVGMNIPETQHALAINEMALLNSRDLREHLLLTCISEQKGVYKTNQWLESANFPLLRVSKDMEEYTPRLQYSEDDISHDLFSKKKHYKEVSREVFAEHCGNAPFDYAYWANIVVQDEDANLYHVQGFYFPDYTVFTVLDDENYKRHEEYTKGQEERRKNASEESDEFYESLLDDFYESDDIQPQWTTMEEYEDIDSAEDSDFFRYFLEIERATDDKVKEVFAEITDTANYGFRVNFKIDGGKYVSYAEQYDAELPAEKQYFQVVETDGHIVYSASHESVFMWIELGSIYSAVFGDREDPKYFIEIDNEEDLYKLPVRTRFIFNAMKASMHDFANKYSGGFAEVSEEMLLKEQIESAAETAAWCNMNGDYEKSLEQNMKVLELAQQCEGQYQTNELATILSTMQKIAILNNNMGNKNAAKEWEDKILAYRDRVLETLDNDEDDADIVAALFAHSLMDQADHAQLNRDFEKLKNFSKETIDILEPRCTDTDSAVILFKAYSRYSFWLDEENKSDIAMEYYEKGERLIRKYHLERELFWQNISSFYNNYAWVLWNRFENEEAIIYYGKAIHI